MAVIADWDGTGYQAPIVLAEFVGGGVNPDFIPEGSVAVAGDQDVASDVIIDHLERRLGNAQGTLRLRKRGLGNFNTYFDDTDQGLLYPDAKVFIVVDTTGGTETIPFSPGHSGGGFSNWHLDDVTQEPLIGDIATGDHIVLAIAEPAAVATEVDTAVSLASTGARLAIAAVAIGAAPLVFQDAVVAIPSGGSQLSVAAQRVLAPAPADRAVSIASSGTALTIAARSIDADAPADTAVDIRSDGSRITIAAERVDVVSAGDIRVEIQSSGAALTIAASRVAAPAPVDTAVDVRSAGATLTMRAELGEAGVNDVTVTVVSGGSRLEAAAQTIAAPLPIDAVVVVEGGGASLRVRAEVFEVVRVVVERPSPLFTQLAQVQKRVGRALGTLITVTLVHTDPTQLDPVTGAPAETRVPLEVRLAGFSGVTVATDKTDPASKYRVTVYDRVVVSKDDAFEWGGERHRVLRVAGPLARTTGERYIAVCEVN